MNPADLFRHETDTITLPVGGTLFRAGDVGKEMFVVLEGALEVRVGDTVVETAGPGSLVGEMALIEDSPRAATVTAKETSRLASVNVRRFHFLVQQNPFFASHVMKVLVERLRNMNKLLQKGRTE